MTTTDGKNIGFISMILQVMVLFWKGERKEKGSWEKEIEGQRNKEERKKNPISQIRKGQRVGKVAGFGYAGMEKFHYILQSCSTGILL